MSFEDKFLAKRIESLRERLDVGIELLEKARDVNSLPSMLDAVRFIAETEDALAEVEYEALLNDERSGGYREKAS